MFTILKRHSANNPLFDPEMAKMLAYLRLSRNEKRDINQRREDWKHGITLNAIRARKTEDKLMRNLLMQEKVRDKRRKTKKSKRKPLNEQITRLEQAYELLMEEYTGYKGEVFRLQAKLESSYK